MENHNLRVRVWDGEESVNFDFLSPREISQERKINYIIKNF